MTTTQTSFALKWIGGDRTNSVWYALAKLTMPKEEARVAAIRRRRRDRAQALEAAALSPTPSDGAVISVPGLDVDSDSPHLAEVATNLVDEEQDNHLASQEQPESSPKSTPVDVAEGQDNTADCLAEQVIQTNAQSPPSHLDRANDNVLLTEDSVRDFPMQA